MDYVTVFIWFTLVPLLLILLLSVFYCYINSISRERRIQPDEDLPVATEVEMATVVVDNLNLKL